VDEIDIDKFRWYWVYHISPEMAKVTRGIKWEKKALNRDNQGFGV
jgi:hypothetical protein